MILLHRRAIVAVLIGTTLTSQAQTTCLEPLPNPFISTPALSEFDRWIDVLGVVDVFGEVGVSDEKLAYVASITAELLDADEDGFVDHLPVGTELEEGNAIVVAFAYEGSPAEEALMEGFEDGTFCVSAVLYEEEVDGTVPGYWGADATVEEVLHVIHHCGYVPLYPDAFDLDPGSSLLTEAMDAARGGQFTTIPNPYPEAAWYHYDDVTCDYGCMAIEYLYWVTVSHMGLIGDEATCEGIANEWEPCTPELLESIDVLAYSLLIEPQYGLPVTAPDGVYCPPVSVLESFPGLDFTCWMEGGELVFSGNTEAGSVRVYDVDGRVVYDGSTDPLLLRVSVLGWARGTYIVSDGLDSVKVFVP
jgi:hypothetical protein